MLQSEMNKIRILLLLLVLFSGLEMYLCYTKGALVSGLGHDYFPILVPLVGAISVISFLGQFLFKVKKWSAYIMGTAYIQLLILYVMVFMINGAIGGHASLYEASIKKTLYCWTIIDTISYIWCWIQLNNIKKDFKETIEKESVE